MDVMVINTHLRMLMCSLILWLSTLLASCAPARIPLQVLVSNIPSSADKLEVTLFLNGQPSNERTLHVTRRLDQFDLQIPSESRGILRVHLSALRDDGCGVARADLRIPLAYPAEGPMLGGDAIVDGRRSFAVELSPESSPCSIGVIFRGEGSVTVTSVPAGLDCRYSCGPAGCTTAGSCSYPFLADQTVALFASPTKNSFLADWMGPCTGRGSCTLAARGDAKSVTVSVSLPPTCSSSNWCVADPTPCGKDITAIWRNDDSEIFVGRGYCGLWRYSTNKEWSQVAVLSAEERQPIREIWSNGLDNVWAAGDAGLLIHFSGQLGLHQRVMPTVIKKMVGIDDSDPQNNGVVAITTDGNVLWISDTPAGFVLLASRHLDDSLSDIWTDGRRSFWVSGPHGGWYLSLDANQSGWARQLETGWGSENQFTSGAISIAGRQSSEVWFLAKNGDLVQYDGEFFGFVDIVESETRNYDMTLVAPAAQHVWVFDNSFAEVSRLFRYRSDTNGAERVPLPVQPGIPRGGWRVVKTLKGTLTILEPVDSILGLALWSYDELSMSWLFTELILPLPAADDERPDFAAVAGGTPPELWLLTQRGEIYRRTQAQLSLYESAAVAGRRLRALWSQGGENVWFVGDEGTVAHFDGQSMHRLVVPTNSNLNAVWGTAYDDVWIGGEQNTLLHWDGTTFHDAAGGWPEGLAFRSIGGTSASNVWAAAEQWRAGERVSKGYTTLSRWNGAEWHPVERLYRQPSLGLVVRGNDEAWLSSSAQHVFHIQAGKDPVAFDLGVAAIRLEDAQAVLWADGPTVYGLGNPDASTGGLLRVVDTGSDQLIRAVWGQGSDIWGVGNGGTILRYWPLSYQAR